MYIPLKCSWCGNPHEKRNRLQIGWRFIGPLLLCHLCIEKIQAEIDENRRGKLNETKDTQGV